jgi:hypothetical protein
MSDTKAPDASGEDFETLKEVRAARERAGPQEELEPGELIEAELARLVSHPRAETARLKQVAADGEEGSTPFIELAVVARWIVPFVLIMIGIVLLIYFKA